MNNDMTGLIENLSDQLERLADLLETELYIKYGFDYVRVTRERINDNHLS